MSDPGDRGRPTLPDAFDAADLFAADDARPVLVVLTGRQVGQRIRLEDAALIGRDPEADLMLTDESVEWHHARVEPREGGWWLVDLSSSRHTEVNGKPIEELGLAPDDQLSVGGVVLRFEVHDSIEQAYDDVVLERLNKDDLTGLLARRKFDVEFLSALLACARREEPLALLVLDVDGVKTINDRHGHLAGAWVIAQVGRTVAEVIGTRGPCCRLGGDEFGIALPGHDLEGGFMVAENVRRRVAERRIEHAGERLTVRISGGVAVFPDHGEAPIELLRAADGALYRAKRGGGDRIEKR